MPSKPTIKLIAFHRSMLYGRRRPTRFEKWIFEKWRRRYEDISPPFENKHLISFRNPCLPNILNKLPPKVPLDILQLRLAQHINSNF